MEQGSAEWLAARVGKVTASRVSDIVAKTKTGWSAMRANYAAELIAERLTGVPAEKFVSGPMQWGTDTEADARAAYQFEMTTVVGKAGFVPHPAIAMAGASPDGYVSEHGLLELKCPNTATHIDTLLGATVPSKYVAQMQFQMACTGRKWCDFASFDPRMPDELRLFIKRVERDDKAIADLEKSIVEFLVELDAKLASLTALYERKEAA